MRSEHKVLYLGPCSLFLCSSPFFPHSFLGFLALCHIPVGKQNMSDYCAPEHKACKSWLSTDECFAVPPSECLTADVQSTSGLMAQ